MDYAFGFDKLAVDLFGAKNAAIDEMRNYFGEKSDFSFGNYVPVGPGDSIRQVSDNARKIHNGKYFVVRSGSKYEMLPGTSGMNTSERFVERSELENSIQRVRNPGECYEAFTNANGLEPEETIPVSIHPMVAESFGTVSGHPNRNIIIVDYLKGDDRKTLYDTKSPVRHIKLPFGYETAFKSYSYFEDGISIKDALFEGGEIMELVKDLYPALTEFGEGRLPGYSWIIEYGPIDGNGRLPVYQIKPLKKIEMAKKVIGRTDSELVFGICSDLELPVTRMHNPFTEGRELENSEFANDIDVYMSRCKMQLVLDSITNSGTRAKVISEYNNTVTRKIREKYGSDVCVIYDSYMKGCELDFSQLKPKAVMVKDDFRSGMQHERANLIQSVPVVLFGTSPGTADVVRINADGVNATVEKC